MLPSPSTSTPRRIARTSAMTSAAVWRSPSRSATAALGWGWGGAETPSRSVIVPSPSRSRPRPNPEKRTCPGGAMSVTPTSLFGPKACPTGSSDIVAMPSSALASAARNRSYFERVMPGPKIATGHPPSGVAPEGTMRVTPTSSNPVTCGAPLRVGVCGMVWSWSSHDGDKNDPKAYKPASAIAEFGTRAC